MMTIKHLEDRAARVAMLSGFEPTSAAWEAVATVAIAIQSKASKRRAILRKTATVLLDADEQAAIVDSMSRCPMIASNGLTWRFNSVKCDVNFTGWKDNVAWQVLLYGVTMSMHIPTGVAEITKTLEQPDAFGYSPKMGEMAFSYPLSITDHDTKAVSTFLLEIDAWGKLQDKARVVALASELGTEWQGEQMAQAPLNVTDITGAIYQVATARMQQLIDDGAVVSSTNRRAILTDATGNVTSTFAPDDNIAVAASAAIGLWMNSHADEAPYPDSATKAGVELAAKVLADKYGLVGEAVPAAPKVVAAAVSVIDPNLVTGINLMLGQATGGKIKDITEVFKNNAVAVDRALKSEAEVVELKRQLSGMTAKTQAVAVVVSDGTIPNGKLEWRKASDIFKGPGGKKVSVLDFDVPYWVWDAPHPDVPNKNPAYKWRPRLLLAALKSLVNNTPMMLVGDTGSGKSTLVLQICAYLNYPCVRINLDGNIERADLIGSKDIVVENGHAISVFSEGALAKAVPSPCVLLLDEYDMANPAVSYVLQNSLEEGGSLMLTEDKGRRVHPHEMFRIAATGNSKGRGDERGAYQGVRVQSEAYLNRYRTWIEVDYMEPKEEVALICEAYPTLPPKRGDEIVKFLGEFRQAFMNGEIMQAISIRQGLAIAASYVDNLSLIGSDKDTMAYALEFSVMNSVTMDAKAKITELAQRCFS